MLVALVVIDGACAPLATGRTIPRHDALAEWLAGQPSSGAVLPRFHAFVADTVLVGHNAAVDMRFLQRQVKRTGVRFEQPVLDTLLLSSILHPNQVTHQLEAIAERFDLGRIHPMCDP